MSSAPVPSAPGRPDPHLDLMVVMPVYNEQDSLQACLTSWSDVLNQLGISWELLAINDGSTDNSEVVLKELSELSGITTISKANEGHGPTILGGYQTAVERAEWVFQVDSDDEMPATSFPDLWAIRAKHDAVFGVRTNREQSVDRKLISTMAGLTARVLFGSGVTDVNVPYRLIRSSVLAPIAQQIPANTFAPNVVISGALSRGRARITELPVPHIPRQTGQVSIAGFGAFKAAARSLIQTVRVSRILKPV